MISLFSLIIPVGREGCGGCLGREFVNEKNFKKYILRDNKAFILRD